MDDYLTPSSVWNAAGPGQCEPHGDGFVQYDTPYKQGGILFLNRNTALLVASTVAMYIHGDFRVLKCQDQQLHWSLVDKFCTWKPGL